MKILLSVVSVLLIVGTAFIAGIFAVPVNAAKTAASSRGVTATSHAAFTYPTNTMQEPGYTNGTYAMAATASVEHLNVYLATDLYSFMLLDEVYDSLTVLSPNATPTVMPWLATHWNPYNVTGKGMTTFDPVTGQVMPVNYIWNVTLRPGVQWSDWTPSTSASNYTFSNFTSFTAVNPATGSLQTYNHTYKWPSLTMNTKTVQSADLILSWKILQSSLDFGGLYSGVVNIVPTSNLSVQFYLSQQSVTFVNSTLESIVLPYHLWVHHDFASTISSAWNYTGQPGGYDAWNMGYNPTTGTASGLVGTGPFMMSNSYGIPQGSWLPEQYFQLFVNPHYFVQYVPYLQQYTPKFWKLYVPQYSSVSAAATAELLGQVDTIELGLPPTFLPTIAIMPHTYIYNKPSTSYGYIQLNSYASNAPFNLTSVRQALNYATNKAYLASVIDQGYTVLGQPIVPVSDVVWHNYNTPQYTYNPAKAMALLNATPGMKYDNTTHQYKYKGKPVTADMQITVASEDPLGVEGALVIAKEWDSIGIPTTVSQEAFTTLVSNLITYSYNTINLGITGIFGDPTTDFFYFYNTSVGLGSGFYLGPFSNITFSNGTFMSGSQVTNLMNHLTNELNTITNFTKRLSIAYEIQSIAAQESTIINLGYPVDILPFTNTTFTGVIKDALPYASFMYWNFLSLHLRSAPAVSKPSSFVPVKLGVGVVTHKTVYMNGQYGNVTVQVRDQYGQPMPGATVLVGYAPQGALLNISSDKQVTNSAGQITWEFKVLPQNPLIYTSDYVGQINISAAAYSATNATMLPGLGYTHIDVQPQPVAYSTTSMPVLVNGKPYQKFNITVTNALTGQPISGYSYDIQSLQGAVNMLNTSSSQSISNITSFNPIFGFGFQSTTILPAYFQYSQNVGTGTGPSSVAYDPVNGFLYVANSLTNNVTVINLTNASHPIAGSISVGTSPSAIAFNSATGFLFVANSVSNNVTVVQLNATTGLANKTTSISVGTSPEGLVFDSYNGFVYVANGGTNNVTALNASAYNSTIGHVVVTNMGSISVGKTPMGMAFDAVNGTIYVADNGGHNVSVINGSSALISKNTVLFTLSVGSDPSGIVFDPMNNNVYVANTLSNNLSVIDATNNTVVGFINVSGGPTSVAFDSQNGYIFAGSGTSGNVTAIAPSSVSGAIVQVLKAGTTPSALAFDGSGNLYVANKGSGNLTVFSTVPVTSYAMTSITGVTGPSGNISVLLAASPSVSYAEMGSVFSSYLFLGDYAAGSSVVGVAPYSSIGELTSASNPSGFGVQQPVEMPVEVAQSNAAASVSISLSVSSPSIGSNGQATVTVSVTNSTGVGVPNYAVTLTSQNALGANRGYLASSTGTQIQAYNPNVFFGSTFMPGLTLVTNATGNATATFSPALYQSVISPGGTFVGFSQQTYADQYLVPFDEFQLSAMGSGGESATTTIASTQFYNSVPPTSVAYAYIQGSTSTNGMTVLKGNATYDLFVNSTLSTPYGPSASGVPVTISVSAGNVSSTSGTTAANGSVVFTYVAPNVSVLTPVTITVKVGGASPSTTTETIYLLPSYTVIKTSTITKTTTKTVSTVPAYAFGLIVLFAILTVVFAALYVSSNRRKKGGSGGSTTTATTTKSSTSTDSQSGIKKN